uniref:Uncharacterized protein n=1 Tax=Rhizophora mucronata TaxID=61149 RepID=A0A2P2QUN3_RHIMU
MYNPPVVENFISPLFP